MTQLQLNNVDGEYTEYTDSELDYGTVEGTQTQSPIATSGPNEVTFYISYLVFYLLITTRKKEQFWGSKRNQEDVLPKEVSGMK